KASGALILGFVLPSSGRAAVDRAGDPAAGFQPNAWLRITADNQVTMRVETPELGQGSQTYTAMMIAEELEIDWSAIKVEPAPTIPAIYSHLHTGGSGGVEHVFAPMRRVGAQAREMLITAAANRWQAPRKECRAQNGTIRHGPTGRRLTYGELVD